MDAYHDAHFVEHPARVAVWRAVARYLAPYLPADGDIVELGAGFCHWINAVQGRRRVAVDIWPGVSRFAAPGVEPLVLDVGRDLSAIADATFDAVLASNLLEHFPPDTAGAVVAGIRRILRPGGRMLLIQPNFRYAWRSYFDDYTHRAVFTDVSLPALLRSRGFVIERVDARFLPYSMQGMRMPVTERLVGAYLRAPYRPRAGQMLVVAANESARVR